MEPFQPLRKIVLVSGNPESEATFTHKSLGEFAVHGFRPIAYGSFKAQQFYVGYVLIPPFIDVYNETKEQEEDRNDEVLEAFCAHTLSVYVREIYRAFKEYTGDKSAGWMLITPKKRPLAAIILILEMVQLMQEHDITMYSQGMPNSGNWFQCYLK